MNGAENLEIVLILNPKLQIIRCKKVFAIFFVVIIITVVVVAVACFCVFNVLIGIYRIANTGLDI